MQTKRTFIIAFVVSIILLLTSIVYADFWGSSRSNKYHNPSCKWAQKIKPANLVKFNTPEEAIKAGYQPCKICKPPIKSRVSVDEFIHSSLPHFRWVRKNTDEPVAHIIVAFVVASMAGLFAVTGHIVNLAGAGDKK